MEARVAAQTEELIAGRHFMDSLLEALPAGVIAFDNRNKVSLVNAAAADLLGRDPGAAMGSDAAAIGVDCHGPTAR